MRPVFIGILALATLIAPKIALAQDQQPSSASLLDDFRHYVITRQDEMAQAAGIALLNKALAPDEFVGLVEDSRFGVDGFDNAIRRGLFIDSLESIASQLEQLYEQGRRDKARNPDEIAANISLLAGNQRGRILATQRLQFASEYAAPQLLQVLLARTNPALESEVERVLVSMGADVVAPLSAALLKVDPVTQERLAVILGQTQHPAALAPLYDLETTTKNTDVKQAAQRAIARISGSFNPNLKVSDLYMLLAEDYFDRSQSLTRFPGEGQQLLWTFDPSLGLYPTAVLTEVFDDTRAMQLLETSLQHDSSNTRAVALWIAANFMREIDTPAGYTNPVYSSDRRDALYFAVAAGPTITQEVLTRALTNRNTRLARRAIGALRQSAGGAGLWRGLGDTKPLLDALSYPDRRVQYEAALAIGAANPVEPFPGADRVTPLLASAIRNVSARFALVVSPDFDQQQQLSRLLISDGYDALPAAATLTDAAAVIAEAPGLDLLIVAGAAQTVEQTIDQARNSTKLQATPILGILPVTGWNELHFQYDDDALTDLRRSGISEQNIVESFHQLVANASGSTLTLDESRAYALDALTVLRDLAISGSSSLSVSDAATPLIKALSATTDEVRLQVADVLARIGQKKTQVALMDAALDATDDEQVALLEKVTRSVKTFGDQLEARQVKRLVTLTNDDETQVATAAAALMGALNLQGREILDLILATR